MLNDVSPISNFTGARSLWHLNKVIIIIIIIIIITIIIESVEILLSLNPFD